MHDATNNQPPFGIEVFISSASEDYPHAMEVFRHLSDKGVRCFFSEMSIDKVGVAEYKRTIDHALESCEHLMVVTTSRAHTEKQWVKYEWDAFCVEKLSGRKAGNLFTAACGGVMAESLPIALRQLQVFRWPAEKERLLPYIRPKAAMPDQPQQPTTAQSAIPNGRSEAALTAEARQDQHARRQPSTVKVSVPKMLVAEVSDQDNQPEFLSRVRGFVLAYLWRRPIWPHDPSDPTGSTPTSTALKGFDFALRAVRFTIVALTPLICCLVIVNEMDTGPNFGIHRIDIESWIGSIFWLGVSQWQGWLTSHLRRIPVGHRPPGKNVIGLVLRYFWRLPIWPTNPKNPSETANDNVRRLGDFLLRLLRLVIVALAASTLCAATLVAVPIDWSLGSAAVLWIGWLTSGMPPLKLHSR